jgi:mannose-6-phosphate isomerase-like protein (cupin superfamily)
MIERVSIGEKHCAMILRSDFRKDGIEFFTQADDTLQLGYMSRGKGYVIQPHVHKPVERMVEFTHEVLFIKTGRVKVNFFDDDGDYQKSSILEQGDVILLTLCGHGFEMLEDSEIIEVKQGPYAGHDDKHRL